MIEGHFLLTLFSICKVEKAVISVLFIACGCAVRVIIEVNDYQR